jgi:hypothetical protein
LLAEVRMSIEALVHTSTVYTRSTRVASASGAPTRRRGVTTVV